MAMPFKKGQSGNPAGRPKGLRDRRVALRYKLTRQLPDILKTLTDAAKGGDIHAAKLILERTLPPLKSAGEPLTLRMNPQFNLESLKHVVRDVGIAYVSLGEEFGALTTRNRSRSAFASRGGPSPLKIQPTSLRPFNCGGNASTTTSYEYN